MQPSVARLRVGRAARRKASAMLPLPCGIAAGGCKKAKRCEEKNWAGPVAGRQLIDAKAGQRREVAHTSSCPKKK